MYHYSSRLQRVIKRVASRFADYSPIREASDLPSLDRVAATLKIQCFNGNIRRTKIVQALIEQGGCTHFVETGTSHAATAIAAHRIFGLPLHTCEISPSDYRISRLMTAGLKDMNLYNQDCIPFLRDLARNPEIQRGTPFFYLDAHEGKLDSTSLPLEDEIRALAGLDRFVVLIDDFLIPEHPEYKHGTYGERSVEIGLIGGVLAEIGIPTAYFPDYPAAQETGYPSGFCVFWRDPELDRAVAENAFPLNLLKAYAIPAVSRA